MSHSAMPFDLGLVIEQLKPLMPETISHIGSTAEFSSIAALSQPGLPTPAVFVVPNSETGHQDGIAVRQTVTVSFSVIIVVQSYHYDSHNPQLPISSPVIGAIRQRLMGWRPPIQGARETHFVQGQILQYSQSYLAWIETYQTKVIMGVTR